MASAVDRLRRLRPSRIGPILRRESRRAAKRLWQRALLHRAGAPVPVLVVGCQRSGTDMLMEVFDRARETEAWNENVYSRAFLEYRLRPPEVVAELVRRSPARAVCFKPVCDSHLTDRMLASLEGARAIWMHRDWADVVNSAVRNFGSHQLDIQRRIAAGEVEALGWRAERLPEEIVATIRALAAAPMTPEEGAALFWYTRNHFFFSLGLDRDPRVLPMRYEDLVLHPEDEFDRLARWLGIVLERRAWRHVSSSSVGRRSRPSVREEIEQLCGEMQQRLDATNERVRSRAAPEAPPRPAP